MPSYSSSQLQSLISESKRPFFPVFFSPFSVWGLFLSGMGILSRRYSLLVLRLSDHSVSLTGASTSQILVVAESGSLNQMLAQPLYPSSAWPLAHCILWFHHAHHSNAASSCWWALVLITSRGAAL